MNLEEKPAMSSAETPSGASGATMDADAWRRRPAVEAAEAIAAGRLDPVALTEAFLAAAERSERVYPTLLRARALREAAAARDRAAAGTRRSPLDGVPVSWKDLFDVAGARTGAGSKLRPDHVAAADAEAVARGARAGLVALGKTTLTEFAFSGLGYNPVVGTAPNPFDPDRAPGGSSSGAAASVSLGLAAAAVGTDTGGSVRVPSAWQGLVGLKTTIGRVPMDGVAPLSPSLDTIGPMTRTVADAAALYAVLADAPRPDLAGARLAGAAFLAAETVVTDDLDPEIAAAYDAALARLEAAGARVTRAPAPEFAEFERIAAREGTISNTEGWALWGALIEANPGVMFDIVEKRFRTALDIDGVSADRGRLAYRDLMERHLARTAGYDAVLAPTTPGRAPLLRDLTDETRYLAENRRALRNTRIGNFLALSALALPTGVTASGHPASLMLMAPPGAEAKLLRLGAAIEAEAAAPG